MHCWKRAGLYSERKTMRIVMVCIMGVNTKQGRKDAPSRARDPQRRERGLARQEGCHIWLRGFRSCPSRPVTSQVTLGKWVNLWESWFLGCEAGVVIHRAPVRLQWDNGWLWNGFDNWKHCTNVRNYYCFFITVVFLKTNPHLWQHHRVLPTSEPDLYGIVQP